MNTKISIANVGEVVASGKVVISGDDSIIVSMIKGLVVSGDTGTFYVSSRQYLAVKSWYWTPEVIARTGVKVVPDDEIARIGKELGMTLEPGRCFSNYRECPNGHPVGLYEFIKQGIDEHGRQTITDVIGGDAPGTYVVRVNPTFWEHCGICGAMMMSPKYYSLTGPKGERAYQCCKGSALPIELSEASFVYGRHPLHQRHRPV